MVKQTVVLHTVEYFSATKWSKLLKHFTSVDLKGVMLSLKSQSEKVTEKDSIYNILKKTNL